jgi:FtsZ-binding cell division protein ZapB
VNDIKVIQLEVDNLKKRLEQLHYDNAKYIEKSKINFMDKAKALEEALAARCMLF